MIEADSSHFSHVVAAVQRTGNLPGGEIRGLPQGKTIDGLQGVDAFALDISEAQKELSQGRPQSALDKVKQLSVKFDVIANRWDSFVVALICDIRQGKQLKNLEKLKELKAAQLRMQQLIIPARKAFQDLIAALDHAMLTRARSTEPPKIRPETPSRPVNADTPADGRGESPVQKRENEPDDRPSNDLLGSFSLHYAIGPKVSPESASWDRDSTDLPITVGEFYFLEGMEPKRVIRIRGFEDHNIIFYDTHRSRDAMVSQREMQTLALAGIWKLVKDKYDRE